MRQQRQAEFEESRLTRQAERRAKVRAEADTRQARETEREQLRQAKADAEERARREKAEAQRAKLAQAAAAEEARREQEQLVAQERAQREQAEAEARARQEQIEAEERARRERSDRDRADEAEKARADRRLVPVAGAAADDGPVLSDERTSARERAETLLQAAAARADSGTSGGAPGGGGGDGGDERNPGPWGRWDRPAQVAAAVIVFLAASVGVLLFKVVSTANHNNSSAAPVFPSTGTNPVLPPVPTVPSLPVVPTTEPIATSPATSPKAAPAPTRLPAPVPATAAALSTQRTPPTTTAPLRPCTPGDLSIVTTTDRATYGPGDPVVMTTKVTDVNACIFQPVPVGQYSCPDSLVAESSGGSQAFPAPGQQEQCNPHAASTLQPGASDTVTTTWNGQVDSNGTMQDAPPGSYVAVATWGWSAGPGQPPYTVNAPSATFTIS